MHRTHPLPLGTPDLDTEPFPSPEDERIVTPEQHDGTREPIDTRDKGKHRAEPVDWQPVENRLEYLSAEELDARQLSLATRLSMLEEKRVLPHSQHVIRLEESRARNC